MMTSSNRNIFHILALCAGNSLVIGKFPSQKPGTRGLDIFFDLCLNKQLSKQLWGWCFEMPSHSSWRHCNVCSTTQSAFQVEELMTLFKEHIWKSYFPTNQVSMRQIICGWLILDGITNISQWFRQRFGASLAPSHCLNHWWFILNPTVRNIFGELLHFGEAYSWKYIYICCLQNGGHCVHAPMCQ